MFGFSTMHVSTRCNYCCWRLTKLEVCHSRNFSGSRIMQGSFKMCAQLVHVSLSIAAQRSYQNSSFHVMDLLRIKWDSLGYMFRNVYVILILTVGEVIEGVCHLLFPLFGALCQLECLVCWQYLILICIYQLLPVSSKIAVSLTYCFTAHIPTGGRALPYGNVTLSENELLLALHSVCIQYHIAQYWLD